jgi:hypothetical protein
MDSVVLGLTSPLMVDVEGKVLGFHHNFALDDDIGSYACLQSIQQRVTEFMICT